VRHLNEYVSLDVEMAWIDSEQDLMDLEVRILKTIFRGLEKDCAAELALWNATVPSDAEVERIPRVSHDQAREMIGSIGGHKVYDVNPEGERILCDWAVKEHGVDAIFVHGFPRKKRPFYTYPVDRRITMGFDCLSMFKYGCPPHCGFARRVPGCLRLTPRGGPYPLMTSDHLRHRG